MARRQSRMLREVEREFMRITVNRGAIMDLVNRVFRGSAAPMMAIVSIAVVLGVSLAETSQAAPLVDPTSQAGTQPVPAKSPVQKGSGRAAQDIKDGKPRILHYGKPWSLGKPLIDDASGLTVEIVKGCVVTPDFVAETDAYNTVMRRWAKAHNIPAQPPSSMPVLQVTAPLPAATGPEAAGLPAPLPSQWSAPTDEGLQTRLVFITRSIRPGKPVFIQFEVRHKDGTMWAQNTTVSDYLAEVVVRDEHGRVVDSLSVRLMFRTMVPAGAGISVGVFPAGKASADLSPGTYSLSITPRVSPDLTKRGAVQLPAAGPVEFSVPVTPNSPAAPDSLQPDYQQGEELAAYMKTREWSDQQILIKQGKAILPGLVALVEKGDGPISQTYPVQRWQQAAFIISEIGDQRAVPFLVKRLDDPGAMNWRFVWALGQLGVKQAVPRLIEELRTMDARDWEVTSQAYGSRATYLIEALERITGQRFPKNKSGKVTDRDATLKAVNDWWEKTRGKQAWDR